MSHEEAGWVDPGEIERLPGWQRYYVGVLSVIAQPDDPEETMQVALTHRDLALFTFGAMLVGTLFPECVEAVRITNKKLIELSAVQEFIPWEPGEVDLPGE